jgi:hypothetical protein
MIVYHHVANPILTTFPSSEETEEMTVEEYDLKEWSNLFYQGYAFDS